MELGLLSSWLFLGITLFDTINLLVSFVKSIEKNVILEVIYEILGILPVIFNYWSKRGINGPKPKPGFGNILDQFITPKPYLELGLDEKNMAEFMGELTIFFK